MNRLTGFCIFIFILILLSFLHSSAMNRANDAIKRLSERVSSLQRDKAILDQQIIKIGRYFGKCLDAQLQTIEVNERGYIAYWDDRWSKMPTAATCEVGK